MVEFEIMSDNEGGGVSVIVKVLKTEVNDHRKWVDEILSLAWNSKFESVKIYLDKVNHRLKGLIIDPTITNNDDLNGNARSSNK